MNQGVGGQTSFTRQGVKTSLELTICVDAYRQVAGRRESTRVLQSKNIPWGHTFNSTPIESSHGLE